jgi:hypothetical protein
MPHANSTDELKVLFMNTRRPPRPSAAAFVLAAVLATELCPMCARCEPAGQSPGGSVLQQATLTLRAAKRFSPRRRWFAREEEACRHCGRPAETHHGTERFCTASAEKLRWQLQLVLRLQAADAFLRGVKNAIVGRRVIDAAAQGADGGAGASGQRLRGGGGGAIDYSRWTHLDESSSHPDVRNAAFWDLGRRPEDGDFSSDLSAGEPVHGLHTASCEQSDKRFPDPRVSVARRVASARSQGASARARPGPEEIWRQGNVGAPDDSESSRTSPGSSSMETDAAASGAQERQLREEAATPWEGEGREDGGGSGRTQPSRLADEHPRPLQLVHAATQLAEGAESAKKPLAIPGHTNTVCTNTNL